LMLADIPPDRTAFDARELFGDDYDRICTRREQLLKFKKNQAIVERLVSKFTERERIRGGLVWRWADLRAKRQTFGKDHEETLAKLRDEKTAREANVQELEAELADRHNDVAIFSERKGQLLVPLKSIEDQDKEFKDFPEELECAALANLKQDVRALERQLANVEGESREKAKRNLDRFAELAKQKQQVIAHFDHIVVTMLRSHFDDEELNTIFRILNRELLELPLGKDGITILRQDELLNKLRALLTRMQAGVYQDAAVSFPLPKTGEPLAGLENVDTAREKLAEYQADIKRWKEILAAIEQREKLESELTAKRVESDLRQRKLLELEQYRKAKADEARLRVELKNLEARITAANESIAKLTSQVRAAVTLISEAESAIKKHEDDFAKIIDNFGQCKFPEFPTEPHAPEDAPYNFVAAISLFLKQQDVQSKLTEELATLFMQIEQCFGDTFNGAEESETVEALAAELEAIAEKEEAMTRDWNAHIQGLKATFDHVLRNLEHVRSAATNINREFAKVQVSNLKAVRAEVIDQSDLIGGIKRLAAFEPGGLFDTDPQQESAIANFRRRIQDNPVIRFTDLFTLGFTVVGADGEAHTYHNFRQIESHGTTITVKVLFNLLLLKNQLRRNDCAVPFFLDEIQTLDPANRHAILRTARQLGFIAITAAPEAVSEVDALYFLKPQNGRIVLRNKHRVTVKRAVAVAN